MAAPSAGTEITGKPRITDALVKDLTPPAKGNTITYDGAAPSAIRGFGIRVTAAGAKSFVLNYRFAGVEYRHTIGAYPTWSVQAAREEAKQLRRKIDKGINPAVERREKRDADTVKELADRYIADYLPRKAESSQAKNKAMLENDILPEIGRMKVADVTLDDMERLHAAVTKRGAPVRANRVLATASKMFSLAVRWRMRPDNPCRGIERNPENQRRRYLSPAEIAKLGEALAKYPSQNAADCVRFCLLTGCRSGEAMAAKWQQFELERGTWTKPTLETKQRRLHSVPLSAPAMALLNQLRAKADEDAVYVFPGRKKGEPLKQIRTCWEFVTKAAVMGEWVKDDKGKGRWKPSARPHDLRHSFASIAVSGGASLPLIGGLLGHSQPRTTQRYAHLFDDALRTVADRVGEFVGAAGKPSATVVHMKANPK